MIAAGLSLPRSGLLRPLAAFALLISLAGVTSASSPFDQSIAQDEVEVFALSVVPAVRNAGQDEFDNSPENLLQTSFDQSQPSGATGNGFIQVQDIFPFLSGDASLDGQQPVSSIEPPGALVTLDYDAYRGLPDGGWENNGIRIGFNRAIPLGVISEISDIAFQMGASIGVYDWGGTDYRMHGQEDAQTQGFFTYGLYHRPTESSRLVGGLVQDWMFARTYGVFGTGVTMSQLRGQLGYALNASNEFGVWSTVHVLDSTQQIAGFGSTTYQPLDQVSGYWHHKWMAFGPDSWLSVGAPMHGRLTGDGTLGDYLVSAGATCPFSDTVSFMASVTYLHQTGSPGPTAAPDEAWNFSVGLCVYPRRNGRSQTVAGQRWMPLMPVANNGTFLVDTNHWY